MRNDNLELAQRYIIDNPGEPIPELTESDLRNLENIKMAFDYIRAHPLSTKKEQRSYIMKECGVSDTTAYNLIATAKFLMPNDQLRSKQYAKVKVDALLDEQYTRIKNGDHKGADAIHKLIQDYVKAYRLDIDEGELIDAQEALKIDKVLIVNDPGEIGVTLTERDRREDDRLARKYGWGKYAQSEIEFEEVDNEENIPS